MAEPLMEIDGSIKEGGGQILRVATALSCLLRKPIKIFNIRAGRDRPGLRPQHLTGLQLVNSLCQGQLDDAKVESTAVTFRPGQIKSGNFSADTKTAGSVCLLMQVSLPCLLFANGPAEVVLKGGTNAEFAPQIDYFDQVFQPMVKCMGVKYKCDVRKRGYYPKGGGVVHFSVSPLQCHLQPIVLLDRGHVIRITGAAFVAGVLPKKMAHSMAQAATRLLKKEHRAIPVDISAYQESRDDAVGNGSGINIVAETSTGCRLASSALGRRGVDAERVGEGAAEQLLSNLRHGGCVDEHLQDQLVVFMALAKGKSQVKTGPITLHTETAIAVTELMLEGKVKFVVIKCEGETNLIECEGIGLTV